MKGFIWQELYCHLKFIFRWLGMISNLKWSSCLCESRPTGVLSAVSFFTQSAFKPVVLFCLNSFNLCNLCESMAKLISSESFQITFTMSSDEVRRHFDSFCCWSFTLCCRFCCCLHFLCAVSMNGIDPMTPLHTDWDCDQMYLSTDLCNNLSIYLFWLVWYKLLL